METDGAALYQIRLQDLGPKVATNIKQTRWPCVQTPPCPGTFFTVSKLLGKQPIKPIHPKATVTCQIYFPPANSRGRE